MLLVVVLQTVVLCCVTVLCWFWCYELCWTLLRWCGDLAQARTASVSSFLTAFRKKHVLPFQQSWKGRRSLRKISIIFVEFCRYFPKWSSFMCSLPIAISTRLPNLASFPPQRAFRRDPTGDGLVGPIQAFLRHRGGELPYGCRSSDGTTHDMWHLHAEPASKHAWSNVFSQR